MGDCNGRVHSPKDHIEHNRRVLANAIRVFTDSYWASIANPDAKAIGIRIPVQRGKAGNIRVIPEEEHDG